MQEILEKIQVHIPYDLLREKLLSRVIRERINPEIGFGCLDLERFAPADFRKTAERLVEAALSITFHAPFMDLRPGAIDPAIRRVTLERLRRVCDLIPWFRPRTIVCHAAFDERYYGSAAGPWLENSLETWNALLDGIRESETVIALENVYERNPEPLRLLLTALGSERFRFCFDTGHANAFGDVSSGEWMAALGGRLAEIHLHDNRGRSDEHLPIGEGTFPFPALFEFLRTHRPRPILTVESHSERDLQRMLEVLRSQRLLAGL
jgi:sugar phosphate isomerase/epimerase